MGNVNLTFDKYSTTLATIHTVADFKRVFGIYSKQTIKNTLVNFNMDLYLFFAYREMPHMMKYLEKKYDWDIYTKSIGCGKNAYMIAVEYNRLDVLKYLDSKNYDIYRTITISGLKHNAYQLQRSDNVKRCKKIKDYLRNRYFGTEDKLIKTYINSEIQLYKNEYGSHLLNFAVGKKWGTAIVCILNICNNLSRYSEYLFSLFYVIRNDFHIFELFIISKINVIKSNPEWLNKIIEFIYRFDYLDGYKYIEDIGLLKNKKFDMTPRKKIGEYIGSKTFSEKNKPIKSLDSLSEKILCEIDNYVKDVSDMKEVFDKICDIIKD